MQFCGMLFMLQTFLESSDGFLVPLRLISSLAFTTALDEVIRKIQKSSQRMCKESLALQYVFEPEFASAALHCSTSVEGCES